VAQSKKRITKAWVYRYWENGTRYAYGLGSLDTVSLKEAREQALDYRKLRRSGEEIVSPKKARAAKIEQRARVEADRMTFRLAAEAWLTKSETEWKPGTYRNVADNLRLHAYPVIGDLGVADVDTKAVLRIVEPIWRSKTKTAKEVRRLVETVIDFAVAKGFRNPGDNPARWATQLEHHLPKDTKPTENHPKLPFEQMPAFMPRLRATDHPASKALEFAILTATRKGEVIGDRYKSPAPWSEVDFEKRLWTISKDRMKMKAEHKVPISDVALALLQSLPRTGDLIFPGLAPNSVNRLLDTFGLADAAGRKVVPHGFRGTFSTWAAEQGISYDVREACLAHDSGSHVERIYSTPQFLEQRRLLMDAWANYCSGVEPAGENVTMLRRA
jgi:integrase